MTGQDAESALNNKGVTPEHHETVPEPLSPDSQSDENFFTPNQSAKSSPSKAGRPVPSSPDSDTYLSSSEHNDHGTEIHEHEASPKIMTSFTHDLQDKDGIDTTKSPSALNETDVFNNMHEEDVTNGLSPATSPIINTSSPAQPASPSNPNTGLEGILPTTAAYQTAPTLDTANMENNPAPRENMRSRLEALYQFALEREAARPTQTVAAPRITIAEIPPFRGSSETRTTPSASLDASAIASPDTGILAPISEDGEVLDTGSTVSAATSNLSALAAEFVPTGKPAPFSTHFTR